MIKYNKHLSYFFSKNSRVLSECEQWTYCKSLSVANIPVLTYRLLYDIFSNNLHQMKSKISRLFVLT